ncbi:hypothetical protein KI387_011904 [Taxus chinensis]|uniref:Tryptophan synthase beta chain-like PALP domain-containing protein n=1 Tax=Taxus chinensis TaxID=29808 RepID=A0AA38CFJ8_TAXCH|nr:hypothetical protein KI387_011904 [Taxus chinensis]
MCSHLHGSSKDTWWLLSCHQQSREGRVERRKNLGHFAQREEKPNNAHAPAGPPRTCGGPQLAAGRRERERWVTKNIGEFHRRGEIRGKVGRAGVGSMETLSSLLSSSSSAVPCHFHGFNIHKTEHTRTAIGRNEVFTTIKASATRGNRANLYKTITHSNPSVSFKRSAVADGVGINLDEKTSVGVNSTTPNSSLPLSKVSSESLRYEAGLLGGISDKTRDPHKDTNRNGAPTDMSYLTNILSSKVYEVAVESPLQYASKISQRTGVRILLKREDLQPVFSFKLRGAYNMMAKLPKEQLERGVICSSAGNHAQGVALAAQRLNCDAVIAMPVTTPEIKWKSVERLGATVVLIGDSYDEAQTYAKRRSEEEGRIFIPPFDHPDVIIGQGTIGMEIVHQNPGPIHAVFVPVGGGGLIAGIATYMKQVRPEVSLDSVLYF